MVKLKPYRGFYRKLSKKLFFCLVFPGVFSGRLALLGPGSGSFRAKKNEKNIFGPKSVFSTKGSYRTGPDWKKKQIEKFEKNSPDEFPARQLAAGTGPG